MSRNSSPIADWGNTWREVFASVTAQTGTLPAAFAALQEQHNPSHI